MIISSARQLSVGGIYLKSSEHFALKVDLLEAGKMGDCKDLSECDMGHIVMATWPGQSTSAVLV